VASVIQNDTMSGWYEVYILRSNAILYATNPITLAAPRRLLTIEYRKNKQVVMASKKAQKGQVYTSNVANDLMQRLKSYSRLYFRIYMHSPATVTGGHMITPNDTIKSKFDRSSTQ